jgi:hypothetical protein
MAISPNQCRAARGLFAMSRQELANASGVSLRTISSFEDVSDRLPTAANLASIQAALQRLGVVFEDGGGVQWLPPFSGTQTRVILALEKPSGPGMVSSSELFTKTGCSRTDLELLVRLQILTGVDGYPMLTAIGLHMPGLMRDHELRESARQIISAPSNYTVRLDEQTVFHAQTAAVFRIEKDGTLSTLFDKLVPQELRNDVIAGAREALRLFRERDPRVVGNFAWR